MNLLESDLDTKPFYHGTARKKPTEFRPVVYFTPSRKDAAYHAVEDSEIGGGEAVVVAATLSLHKPVRLPFIECQDLHMNHERVRELMQAGYDCAMQEGSDVEIVVFDPKSIKVLSVDRLI